MSCNLNVSVTSCSKKTDYKIKDFECSIGKSLILDSTEIIEKLEKKVNFVDSVNSVFHTPLNDQKPPVVVSLFGKSFKL